MSTPVTRAPERALSTDTDAVTVLGYPHDADGSGWYRYYLPFAHVARHTDHNVLLPEPGSKFTPDDDQLSEIDGVSAQRLLDPVMWGRWKGKTALIYETDDDILQPDSASGLPHMFDPAVRDGFVKCIEMSDLVTVSTEPLAEQMRKHNPNVRILPNHIDGDLLYMERRRADRLTIGWAGGMSHLGDWSAAADPIADVLAANLAVDLHFVGWDFSPMLKRKARYTPWKQNVWDYYKGIDFDIGVAPLADTPFNESKSHIKALEYAALGIPVVAANLAPYRSFVQHGVTGFLVNNADEWRTYLRLLINDSDAREEMGAAAKKRASEFVIQTGWRLWRDAFEEVCR